MGQFVSTIFPKKDVEILDEKIKKSLQGKSPDYVADRNGNKAMYPIGTVAKVEHNGNTYFCFASTDADDKPDPTENFKNFKQLYFVC